MSSRALVDRNKRMKSDEFEAIFETMVSEARQLLVEKAKEYADDGDRLHNFKAAMHAQGLKTMMQANRGMTTKHTVSINDMVWSGKDYPIEKWKEKIGDEFNYLILLMACIIETKSENEPANTEATVDFNAIRKEVVDAYRADQPYPPKWRNQAGWIEIVRNSDNPPVTLRTYESMEMLMGDLIFAPKPILDDFPVAELDMRKHFYVVNDNRIYEREVV
jgi:hypothetical protein